jgi:hypothetical protein
MMDTLVIVFSITYMGLRMRVRISTASGSERGLWYRPLDGATHATARGTDPAILYMQSQNHLKPVTLTTQ